MLEVQRVLSLLSMEPCISAESSFHVYHHRNFFIVQETVEDARLKTLMIYLFTVTSLEWCILVKIFYMILITTLTFSSTLKAWNVVVCLSLTSFLCFNSSLLKLLRSKAKNKLSTIKFPTTRAGMKIARQEPGLPCNITFTSHQSPLTQQLETVVSNLTDFVWTLMQSHSGSIHSPHNILKIIMKEWKKSVKFHLKYFKFKLTIRFQ